MRPHFGKHLHVASSTLTLIISLLFIQTCANAQSYTGTERDKIRSVAQQADSRYVGYLNSPWNGDDRAYSSIRTQIEREISRGKSPISIMEEWKKPYNKNPQNLQLIFGYMFASEKVNEASISLPAMYNSDVIAANTELEYLPVIVLRHIIQLPHTYNFNRLVFLASGSDVRYISDGKRLYSAASSDVVVARQLIRCLAENLTIQNVTLGLNLASEIATTCPGSAEYWDVTGGMLYTKGIYDHDVNEMDNGMAEYVHALKLIPNDSIFYQKVAEFYSEYPKIRAGKLKYWATLPPGAKGAPTPPNE